jgi:hypothetical protein
MDPGFMLISYRRSMSPYDNPISLWDMRRVVLSAERAGIDLTSRRVRTMDVDGKRRSVAASLGEALESTLGWHVFADEAAQLGERLPETADQSDDPIFILQMAKFFEKAAKYGGFFVF